MPMHPDVLQARVVREDNIEGDAGLTSFSILVPSVGFGELFVRQTGECIEIIDMFARPRRNGIGTRLLRQVLEDIVPTSVHGANVDDVTRSLLAPYIRRARLEERPLHIPFRVFSILPIVSLLDAAGIQTDSIRCVYEPEKYQNEPDSVYISGTPQLHR